MIEIYEPRPYGRALVFDCFGIRTSHEAIPPTVYLRQPILRPPTGPTVPYDEHNPPNSTQSRDLYGPHMMANVPNACHISLNAVLSLGLT